MNAWAFIKRDFRIEKNYKLDFFLRLAGMFLYLCIFYFMGFWLKKGNIYFGGTFFLQVFLGIVFANILLIPLNAFSESLRQEQLYGTMESLFLSSKNNFSLLFGGVAYPLVYGFLETIIYLGALFFIPLPGEINILFMIPGVVLGLFSMAALGIISASFILAFRRGDPVNFLLNAGLTLLGGVFFPVGILSGWLFKLALINPITHSLELIRIGFGFKSSFSWSPMVSVIFLAVFSMVVLPVSFYAFKLAVKHVEKTGSLDKY
ncbi:MAG: ABC transporter permease [Candidatus Firestonebacteria bacterium]